MKLCKDCNNRVDTWYCKKYKKETDYVFGKDKYYTCNFVRLEESMCGKKGEDYEEKITLLERSKGCLNDEIKVMK